MCEPLSIETNAIDESISSVINKCKYTSPPVLETPEMKYSPPSRSSSRNQEDSKIGIKTDCQKNARGARICQLYREHPQLMRSAHSRSSRNNEERRKIWSEIVQQINLEFPNLREITVVEAKKLVDYHKGKQRSFPSSTPSPSPEKKPFFTTFLEQAVPDTSLDEEKLLELGRRERFKFLTKFTAECMRVCEEEFNSRSRSREANLKRDQLWENITDATNWMFQNWQGLESLQAYQVKKTHSNFKRRNPKFHNKNNKNHAKRMNSESSTISDSSGSPEASEHRELSVDPPKRDDVKLVDLQNPVPQMPQQFLNPLVQNTEMQEALTFYKSYFLYNEVIKISSAIAKTDFQ